MTSFFTLLHLFLIPAKLKQFKIFKMRFVEKMLVKNFLLAEITNQNSWMGLQAGMVILMAATK